MTEADLALAKAFLLFSVAGYTITAANTQPHPRFISQGVAGWAELVVAGMTGDRSAWVPSPIPSPVPSSAASSMLINQSGDSSSFPLYLSQRPTLFSHSVSLTHAPKPNLPALRKAEPLIQGFSGAQLDPRSDQPLTLPPALAKAGFQFRL